MEPNDDPVSDVALVRRVLARELDTINEYEALAVRAKDPTIKAFFRHLALEEKEHVAEAMALIRAYDLEQEQKSGAADVRPEHFQGGAPARGAVASSTPQASAPRVPGRFTVGSLKSLNGAGR